MRTVTIQDLKRHGAKGLPSGQVVYLIVNSKPKAAIVPIEEYESIMEMLEDLDDRRVIEERKNEPDLTWEEVFPEDKA